MVRRRLQSFNFEIGHPDLSAALAKDIIEAILPKETRKQAQQQLALEAIARSYPALSKMPREEREKLYSQVIFPAYGVYQPPTFRRLFGAKPESIFPLPAGAEEVPKEFEGVKMVTPTGKRRELKAGITLPPTRAFTFAPSPLLQPEHEAELETQAKALYPESPEDQQTWLKTQKTALMTGIKITPEQIRAWAPTTKEEYKEVHPPPPMRGWAPGTKEEYKEVHPPTVKGWTPTTKEEYKETHPKGWAPQTKEEYLETHAPQPSQVVASNVKVLRDALLRMYLSSGEVWLDEQAHRRALELAKDGAWDEVYLELNEDQRKTFDQVIAKAEPYVKQKGVVEGLYQALRDLQQTRPSAFQRKGGAAPPKTRGEKKSKRFEIIGVE